MFSVSLLEESEVGNNSRRGISPGRLAAVDEVRRTGDERRLVRREEHDGLGDLFGSSDSIERHGHLQTRFSFGSTAARPMPVNAPVIRTTCVFIERLPESSPPLHSPFSERAQKRYRISSPR